MSKRARSLPKPSRTKSEVDLITDEVPRRFVTTGLNLYGRRCLVVGGGNVGTRKALTLAEYDAHVTVVAPEITKLLHAAIVAGEADWICAPYERAVLDGVFLVVAATCDAELNHRVSAEAREQGTLVCNTSDAADCDLIFAAEVTAPDVTVGVHTDGRDPRRAQEIRDVIAALLRDRP